MLPALAVDVVVWRRWFPEIASVQHAHHVVLCRSVVGSCRRVVRQRSASTAAQSRLDYQQGRISVELGVEQAVLKQTDINLFKVTISIVDRRWFITSC